VEKTAVERLGSAIDLWTQRLENLPSWKLWNRTKFGAALHDQPLERADFQFPDPVNKQHGAIMSFLELSASLEALRDVEFYFRRFPFLGLPISRDTHIRYICEMYFNRFYEFKQRLKVCLNAVNQSISTGKLNVGMALKAFDQELRARNGVNHHGRFEDRALDRIWLTSRIVVHQKVGDGWEIEHRQAYRKTSIEWAKRVKLRAKDAEPFLEAVALVMLEHCDYLAESN
jgi:hypothetical protein